MPVARLAFQSWQQHYDHQKADDRPQRPIRAFRRTRRYRQPLSKRSARYSNLAASCTSSTRPVRNRHRLANSRSWLAISRKWSGALAALGYPPADGVVRPLANASRSQLSTPRNRNTAKALPLLRFRAAPAATRPPTAAATAPSPQRRWRLTEPLRASLMWGTGQEHQRRGCPLYAARIEDLGPGDFVKIDCAACHHVALLTPEALMRKRTYFARGQARDMAGKVREANELITKALRTMISDPLRPGAQVEPDGRQRSLPPRALTTNDVIGPVLPSRPEP